MIIIINKLSKDYSAITPRTKAGGGKSFEKKAVSAQIDFFSPTHHLRRNI